MPVDLSLGTASRRSGGSTRPPARSSPPSTSSQSELATAHPHRLRPCTLSSRPPTYDSSQPPEQKIEVFPSTISQSHIDHSAAGGGGMLHWAAQRAGRGGVESTQQDKRRRGEALSLSSSRIFTPVANSAARSLWTFCCLQYPPVDGNQKNKNKTALSHHSRPWVYCRVDIPNVRFLGYAPLSTLLFRAFFLCRHLPATAQSTRRGPAALIARAKRNRSVVLLFFTTCACAVRVLCVCCDRARSVGWTDTLARGSRFSRTRL